jgi:hypothetical protein
MANPMNPAELATLEKLVDSCGLHYLLVGLQDVCHLKADHIRENWQDEKTAHAWGAAAGNVGNAAGTRSVRIVSGLPV